MERESAGRDGSKSPDRKKENDRSPNGISIGSAVFAQYIM